MTTLTLVIKADDDGLKSVYLAAEALTKALHTPAPNTDVAQARFDVLTLSIHKARAELTAVQASTIKAQDTFLGMSQSLSSMATVSSNLTSILQKQNLTLGATREKMLAITESQRQQAVTAQVNASLTATQNAEFAKQGQIMAFITAKTDEQVMAERARTQALLASKVATGELTAAEAKRLGFTGAAQLERVKQVRADLKQGMYQAEILMEEAAAARQAAIQENFILRSFAQLERVKQVRADLKQGMYQAEILMEERQSASWLAIQRHAAAESIAIEQTLAARRAELRGVGAVGVALAQSNAAGLTAQIAGAAPGTTATALQSYQRQAVEAANAAAAVGALTRSQVEAIAVSNGLASSLIRPATGLKELATSTRTANDAFRGLERGASGAAGALWLTYGAMVPMIAAFAAVSTAIKGVKLSAEFESITNYTQAISEGTNNANISLEQLREKLSDIKGVQDNMSELAVGVKDLVKAGFDSAEAADDIATVSKAATIAQEDLGKVTQTTAQQYRAWSDEMVGSERGMSGLKQTANVMGFVAQSSATDFAKLTESMKHTVSLAGLTNMSFVEMTATLGALSNIGLKGSIAGTGLRNMFIRMQNPTEKLKQQMGELEVKFSAFTPDGKMKGVVQLFDDLSKSLAGLTDEARMNLVSDLFGLRALGAGDAVIRQFSQGLAEGKANLQDYFEEVKKVAKEMTWLDVTFAKVTQSTKDQWKLLGTEVQNELTKAFDGTAVKELVAVLRKSVEDGTFRGLVDGLAAVTSGLMTVAKYAREILEVWALMKVWTWGAAAVSAAGGVATLAAGWTALGLAVEGTMAALLANPVGMAALVGYGLYKASTAANKWAAEDQARVATRKVAVDRYLDHTLQSESYQYNPMAPESRVIPDPTKGSGTGTAPLTDSEKNAIEARKQALSKLGEWEVQNAAKVADEVNKARSAETQAGYKTELTILDARHKAFLHTEEVYLAKSRALKVKVIQEQIISAANSVRAYEAKVKSAQDYAKSLRGDPGKYLEARRALAQLKADLEKYKKSLRDGKEDLSLLKALFPLEDEARLEKFRREMDALSDSTKRFAENSQFEVSIATLDEDAAGLARTVEKLRQQMEDYVKAQKLAGTYDPAKFAEFKQEIDKREAAERQAYDGKKALQGDWVSGVKKSFADYAKEAENAFDLGKQAAANAFRSMEDAIVDFVKTGKLSFKSMIDGMIADLVRLVVRMQVTAPLARAFGADMGGAGSIGLGSSLAAIGGTAAIGATMSGPSTASGAAISAGIGLAGVGAQIYTNTVGATMAALQTGVAQAAQQFGMGTVGLSSGFAAEFAALGGETAALGASGGTGVAGTIAGMATAAFAGWAAGIGTFIISILQGESFRMAAAKGVGAGLGAFGGFKAGAAIGATIGGPAGAAIGAAIGTIIGSIGGSWLGSLFGGGSKENQFTLSELVPNMATTFEKEAGFLVSNWQHAANSSETSQWYAPIANAYSDIIGTVQTSFNEQIFDFAEKLPTDLQNMFLAEMAATDFNSLIAEATSGRWGLSGATGALEGIAQKLADSLSTAASTAYFNAFATFLETSSPSALLSSELAGVWDILTSSAQSSVKGIFESASRIMRSDGFEAGAAEMGKATSALAELANALAPITEIIETANLTDYELSLRSINKEFDQYAEALSAAGIDLNKYTDLEKARAIAIRETNQAMVNDYNTVMRDLISQKNILEGTQTPLQIDRLKQSQDMAQFYSEIGQWQLGGYDMLKKIWNLQDIARVKDALSPVKDVLVSIGQTDLQKSMMDLQKWYDEQLGLYQTLRNEGALIGNAYTSALEDLNSAAAYQAQDLISNYIDPITGAWKDFFEGMSTSNLAPVQSMEAFQNRLESLISTADSLEGAQKLQSFVTGEYLPFMQAAAPDYKDVFNDLITSPTSPLNNIKVDLGTVKVDSKAIGDAVAAAIGEAWNGQEINVTINIDGKEIKSSLINLVSSDPDWVMLQGA